MKGLVFMLYFSVDVSHPVVMVLCIAGAVVLFLALVYMALWSMNRRKKQKGIAGERRVEKILRKFARKHRAHLMNSLYLPLYDGCTEIDHVLCGSFGVVVIETKNVGGTITGSGEYLTQHIGNRTHKLRHPQKQNETHIRNIAHHLRKAGLKDVPVHGFVVFSNPQAELKTKAGLYLKELPAALARLPQKRCDGKQIKRALRAVRVRSPFRKLFHDIALSRR